MDASLIEELITKNKPFRIETASGRILEVPHRDFVSFSTRKTSLVVVSYEENGTEHFAIVPLPPSHLQWRRPKILIRKGGTQETLCPISLFETRSAPALLGATHRAFAFYLGNPHFLGSCVPDSKISSFDIRNSSFPTSVSSVVSLF
jgi:hypothetical protein